MKRQQDFPSRQEYASSSSSSSLTSAKDSTLAGLVLFSLSHATVDTEDIIVYVQCGYKNLTLAGSVLLFSVFHATVDIENIYYTYSVVTRTCFLSPTNTVDFENTYYTYSVVTRSLRLPVVRCCSFLCPTRLWTLSLHIYVHCGCKIPCGCKNLQLY